MKISVILQEIGQRDIATIRPDQTVGEATKILSDLRIGALIVSSDGGHIDGIISERDIVRRLGSEGAEILSQPISTVMTSDVHTCSGDDTAIGLLARMTKGRFRHLPVVGPDGRMTGILSIGDIVKGTVGGDGARESRHGGDAEPVTPGSPRTGNLPLRHGFP